MLRLLNPLMQRLGRVPILHRHRLLRDNRSGIHASIHEVYRTPRDLHSMIQRLLPRFQSGKRWQQRRMNVHNAALEGPKEFSLEHPHESSQRDQIHPGFRERLHKSVLGFVVELGPKLSRCNEARLKTSLARPREDARLIHVAHYQHDLRWYFSCSASIRNSDKIRTLARTQHSDAK